MRRALPAALVVAALGAAFALSRSGPSRESLLPLSRTAAEQVKGLDRAAGAAFPLSPDEERRIGEDLDRGLSRPEPAPGSPESVLAARWREFGGTAAGSPLVTRFRGRYAFRTVAYGDVNAFALPGGFVYATEPLLKKLGDDGDAVLFVLGHEIGHVELGHCADAYRLRGSADDPVRAVLGGVLSVARVFAEIQFSSAQELEADAFAVRLMRSLHRDPAAGRRVFDALGIPKDANTKRDPGEIAVEGLTDYFHTHPGGWERRAALERQIEAVR
jgi:beta-barrel assembly-enhancing protease